MVPFREPPDLALGSLDVGLRASAERAATQVPRGGRLVRQRDPGAPPHVLGAAGTGGLLIAVCLAFEAIGGADPERIFARVLLCVAAVITGGISLAVVIRAVDQGARVRSVRAEIVGRAPRRIMRRLARLASAAETTPDQFGRTRVRALRRALSAASSPEAAPWIPRDVVGRAELLLARALATRCGRGAHKRGRARRDDVSSTEIRSLLRTAAGHLNDPTPAIDDLAEFDRRRVSLPSLRPARFVEADHLPFEPIEATDESVVLREEPSERSTAVLP